MGTCPKCQRLINQVRVEGIDGRDSVNLTTIWKCVSYCCPFCNAVLGVQIDPTLLKQDLIAELFAALRKT